MWRTDELVYLFAMLSWTVTFYRGKATEEVFDNCYCRLSRGNQEIRCVGTSFRAAINNCAIGLSRLDHAFELRSRLDLLERDII